MANFCGKCGNRLDAETGLCSNCENDKFISEAKLVEMVKNQPDVDSYDNSGTGIDAETVSENPITVFSQEENLKLNFAKHVVADLM